MALAGETIIAGKIPGERIETAIETADSAAITTTEATVMTVTAPLVIGRTYRVRFAGAWGTGTNGNRIHSTIREDGLPTGTIIGRHTVDIVSTAAAGTGDVLEAEYTATSTADKTFVLTGERIAGDNTSHLEAAATRPSYLYVDYIRN